MEDRIINASIISGNPIINFAANNMIKGVEWEEGAFNKNIIDIFNGEFSLATNYDDIQYSNFAENGVVKNRWKVASEWGKISVQVGTNFNLVYATNYDKNVINTIGYTNYSSLEKIAKEYVVDYNYYNMPEPPPATSDITAMGKYVSGQIGKSFFQFKNRTPYAFKLEVNILKKITTYMEKWALSGSLVWELQNTSSTAFNQTITSGNYYISSDVSSTEKTNQAIGTKPNIALNSNELMQVDTTVNGIPIGKHIADDIIRRYKNGRTSVSCSVILDDNMPRFKVGEIASVYGFNGKSIVKTRDGTDMRFYITSAELKWNGRTKQNIEMLEVAD